MSFHRSRRKYHLQDQQNPYCIFLIYFPQEDDYPLLLQLIEAIFHIMHKLFSLSFRRIANRLSIQELNAMNVAEALQNSKIPPCGQGFLYRLPRDELKQIISIPCPINNLEEASSKAIIASSKALRHHGKINEEKICRKCPFKQNCASIKQPFTGTIENAPKDLLVFWSGLNAFLKPQNIYFRHWVSAYKLGDSIMTALNDLSQGGKQIQQYQRLRVFMLQQHQEIMNKKTQEKQQKEYRRLSSSQIDEKFKLIQKFTIDQNLNSFEEAKQSQTKVTTTSDDFSSQKVEQVQAKSIRTREYNGKPKKQIKPTQHLQNHTGYQSIQKRQESSTQTKYQKYQKPQPKKIQKKHQYQQVVNDVEFSQHKNPKIRVKKQPQNSPQIKKFNAKPEKEFNKNRQKQQIYQQNRKKSYNQKKGYTNKYQDRNQRSNETKDYQYKQYKNQKGTSGNKYQKEGHRKEEPKKQKFNEYSENYSKESSRGKPNTNKPEQFSGYEQTKQKINVRTSPIIQNNTPNLKSQSQGTQTKVGRNVRRRPRSTTSTPQNE